MTVTTSVRAAGGDMLHIDLDDSSAELLDHPWFGHVRFIPKYGRGSTTGEMWGLDLAPATSLDAGITSAGGREVARFSVNGGEVVIADATDPPDSRWAAWVGPWHMVHGYFYPPAWETSDIVETFSRVRWVDTPEGMTAEPSKRYDLMTAMCVTSITGVGLLQVESKKQSSARVPKWQGAVLRAGEVWRIPDQSGVASTSLLHITPTAVAILYPNDAPQRNTVTETGRPGAGTPERALEFLSTIQRLEWTS
ncbi:MAG TPA: hypothetical protein VFC19_34730 [Candidatus Limnocylindrales bacterium]|nr:hypothetical protein [Candidatus Limnocylindrales bacterium]